MDKNISVNICEESCACNSCHAANYDSKVAPFNHAQVDKLYEVHAGAFCFRLCEDCVKELIGALTEIITSETCSDNPEKIKTCMPISQMIFEDMTDFDESCLMCMDAFIDATSSRCIIDDDGSGNLILDGKIVSNGRVICDLQQVMLDLPDGYCTFYTFDGLKEMFGDRVQIAWYNK